MGVGSGDESRQARTVHQVPQVGCVWGQELDIDRLIKFPRFEGSVCVGGGGGVCVWGSRVGHRQAGTVINFPRCEGVCGVSV